MPKVCTLLNLVKLFIVVHVKNDCIAIELYHGHAIEGVLLFREGKGQSKLP